MKDWDSGNEDIFRLAKKVHGWGRIHAVIHLEPDTNEIRDWLLNEGRCNSIEERYTALSVWEKTEVANRLKGELTRKEFTSVSSLLFAILAESRKMPGISKIDDAKEEISLYLDRAAEHRLGIPEYCTILCLFYWADANKQSLIYSRCRSILFSGECRQKVQKAIKKGDALELADLLEIDYTEDLFQCLETDFEKNSWMCRELIAHDADLDRVVKLYLRKLPLAEMRKDPAEELGFGKEYADYNRLINIINELYPYPNKDHIPLVAVRKRITGSGEEIVRFR